jgi:hypothetical protein
MRYEAVDEAIRDGKLWRAKEILQGRLSTPHFDRELLLRYGEVLQSMGDDLEAGRILFCAGARQPNHQELITLFLSKHPRTEPGRFLATMPAMVRRQRHLADYLASAEFEKHGWSQEALGRVRRTDDAPHAKPSRNLLVRMRGWIGIGCIILALISVPVGMITIFSFIISVFR